MGIASTLLYPCSRQILKLKIKTIHVNITTLQLFHKKNVIQDFLMYNKFANKKIRKKVILYDRLIIQRKNYNW